MGHLPTPSDQLTRQCMTFCLNSKPLSNGPRGLLRSFAGLRQALKRRRERPYSGRETGRLLLQNPGTAGGAHH
jgi:hypothetical protein